MNPETEEKHAKFVQNKPKILIVEDEDLTAQMYKQVILRRWPVDVILTDNGLDAIRIVVKEQPFLLIEDLKINGDMDGYDVIQRVRELDKEISIIIMSATEVTKTFKETYNVSRVLTKIVNMQEFCSTLNVFLEPKPIEKSEFSQLGEKWEGIIVNLCKDNVVESIGSTQVRAVWNVEKNIESLKKAAGNRWEQVFDILEKSYRHPGIEHGKISRGVDLTKAGSLDGGLVLGNVTKQDFIRASLNAEVIWNELFRCGYIDINGFIQKKFIQVIEAKELSLDKISNGDRKKVYFVLLSAVYHKVLNILTTIGAKSVKLKNDRIEGIFAKKGLTEQQIIDQAINISDYVIKETDKVYSIIKLIKSELQAGELKI